jgi:hypothetical protein
VKPPSALAILSLLLPLSGCVSYTYVDKNNNRHVIGFVNATIKTTDTDGAPTASRVLEMRTLGLSVSSIGGDGLSVTLGYSHGQFVNVPLGTCIDIESVGPCAAVAQQGKELE